MPFIPALNTARVTLVMQLHGEQVRNVFHVRNATAWSEALLTDLANNVIGWWNDDLAPNLSVDLVLQSVQVRDMTTADGLGVEIAAPPGSGGDVANPAMPGNVAFAIKHKSGFTGRNRNGRSFVTGLPENSQEGNELTNAQRDNLVNAFAALRALLLADSHELVVASFYDGFTLVAFPDGTTRKVPTPRATALLTPVAQFTAGLALDSQRRRLQGRGT